MWKENLPCLSFHFFSVTRQKAVMILAILRLLIFTCAILICRSSAMARYQAFTPNLPDATCRIADLELLSAPLKGSSPPSPVLLFPPILESHKNWKILVRHIASIKIISYFGKIRYSTIIIGILMEKLCFF